MKNCFLLIIAFLLGSAPLFAQEFNAGITGGLVASQLDGDRYEGYNKAGMVGGIYVNRFVTKKTAYQLGLRYIQKGSKRADSKNGVYYKSILNCIEIPVSFRYFVAEKIDLEGGLSLAYLINAKEDTDGTGLLPANPEFNKFELSGLLGVSYHWSKKLAFGAQFNYSITPARSYSSGYEAFMDKGQHNNCLCFLVSYDFTSWR
ncbi:MAG TPA: hypothetical protein DCQ26_14225 [Marinilabiliales bacterium]|jgi:hypothetical protein|nr:MAG: hypothetical protein A2W95_00340 [Bacteroidetes bacterium GWA2_40_14]OFX57500.1 MAG: hypothetical protein A2W84_06385 [Bacteroidetes bacterium GWC2_40_13]OFX71724.1 MAG: hypothetical protein A2W96_10145 [Bacteroidetes bacterium GWD2_40_43]OFX90263.1 MAG: hypothetical protein A2W97_17330 [Bacteroidetes bacterium GWE2_40_63]OFY22101.1 MAG: hypothetical protein A2W88_08945 [Bacteroidetes bacterium GWF2_40_13]OFZ27727.1 MAG: hypothetical protein A2437_02055 [Bacteroidetes bacterium RIFOXYC